MLSSNKIFQLTSLTITFFVSIFIYFEYVIMESYFNQNITSEKEIIRNSYNHKTKEIQLEYSRRMQTILSHNEVKTAIINSDRKKLQKILQKKFALLQKENKYIKSILITDSNNIAFIRSHKPDLYGDDLTNVRAIVKESNKHKKIFYGFEAGRVNFSYRITKPIIYDNIHYGVMDMGISSDIFLDYINDISTKAEVTSLINPKFLDIFAKNIPLGTIPLKNGFLAPNFNLFFEPFIHDIDLDKQNSQIIEHNDDTYLIDTSLMMESFDGSLFGTILVAYDISEEIQEQNEKILLVLLFILLFILSIYFILRFGLKKYEKDLIIQKKRYQTLFQNSTDGIFILKDTRFIDCNNATLQMFNYKSKLDILNLHLSNISPQKQVDGEDSFLKSNRMLFLAEQNGRNIFEWKFLSADNKEFWCEVALTFMNINDEEIIHARIRDISVLKDVESFTQEMIKQKTQELQIQMQKANDANRSKSEFLANMSHEIRTPLNAIMGFIELLKDDEIDSSKLKYLNIVDKSSNNLLEIINDILDFSKIESHQIDLEYRDFNTEDEFHSIGELFKARADEKNINFKIDISSNIPKHLNSDILRIKQVIINLLSNAIKFTPVNKSVILTIEYNDSNLSVSVKDEGIGIANNKLDTIFEAFIQADTSTTRKYGGTGLGLSIGYQLVELLGGKLKVKSQLTKGSEFYFTIPVKEAILKEKSKEIEKNQARLTGHILLVEDNKANQMFMKVVLKKMGFTFDIAFNGLEAINRFPRITCAGNKTKYDVILMDENMPNMNGIEATKEILKLEKELNLPHTPIIALTANALKGDRERFLEAGMDEYLTKPLNKKKLVEVLGRFLEPKSEND